MLFTDDITIYNHYTDSNGDDAWKRTVISGVQWSGQTVKTVSSDGKLYVADTVNVTIPKDAPQAVYVQGKEWKALVDKTGYWTLGTDNLDVIALGKLDVELTGNVTITTLKKQHDNIVTVQTVSDNTNRDRLKTWKVVAT